MRLDGGFAFASTNQIIRSVRHSSCLELDMAKVSLAVSESPSLLVRHSEPESESDAVSATVTAIRHDRWRRRPRRSHRSMHEIECTGIGFEQFDGSTCARPRHNSQHFSPTPLTQPPIHPSTCTYTHLDPHPYRPVIRPSIRPCPSGPRPPPFDVWRESTFDGRSVRTGFEPCSNSLAALACLFQCWPICKLNDCRWLLFSVPWYRVGNDFFIFRYPMAPDLLAINKIEVS